MMGAYQSSFARCITSKGEGNVMRVGDADGYGVGYGDWYGSCMS